ncbi:muconate/chloromuconate family cycloisomerase [Bacillus shivajii]|uniref:muconate/chloromuconate family cycloisomerase n=1 Tax=Bacillus shivajii TaxID=1983719 RepID=UPI001CF9DB4F|nr:muconate/chloromuconate family cycloisomerase [Bacillus shivajii]UCZ52749.1 muconate/chloromuconate family cycloisomerase [Bacillus shivajii]
MKIKITRITADIVDIPLKRSHQFSAAKIDAKPFLILQMETNEGVIGIGEGTTPGIWWGGESVETMKLVIDQYFSPLLYDEDPRQIERILGRMDRQVFGNEFAKATVEMALYDIVGKLAGVPVYQLFGGQYYEKLPTRWALAIGKVEEDVEEAKVKMEGNVHHQFKMKAGNLPTAEDADRAIKVAEKLKGLTTVGVDPNGSWDELTTRKWMDRLYKAGIAFLEQPLPKWDIDGLARLKEMKKVPIMADESASTLSEVDQLIKREAVDIISLKVHKSGGMSRVKKIAAMAEAAGVPCFGGTSLESSIGTTAALHVYSTIPNLTEGCELFGPIWLADDIVDQPLKLSGGHIFLPEESGLGVTISQEKLNKYRRKNVMSAGGTQ